MTDVAQDAQQEQQAVLLAFSNHKEDPAHMQTMQGLLKMAYHVVLTNRLAAMQAKNTETGEEELIFVGVDQAGDSVTCYPLFAPIKAEDVAKYLAPDGAGGWLARAQEESQTEH